jgi:formate hydrogenlyase subunit 3/multisubunit Na+/H+ antiporter MnhD subunit
MSLGSVLLVLAAVFPLLLAALLTLRALRPVVLELSPWAAVPAVALAAVLVVPAAGPFLDATAASVDLPWVLLGLSAHAFDELTPVFLAFTALLWLISGWFSRSTLRDDPRRHVYWAFFLVTMSGNVAGVLSQDLGSFYLFFALMSLASYGLILHERSDAARRAGRVYLVMALFGDVMILAALLLLLEGSTNLLVSEAPMRVAASQHSGWIITLILAGFGVKAGGVLPLHVWLPLAHPVAPTPASALLSGAMIKMGLLGWLRFLPFGLVALPEPGLALSTAGIVAAFYGASIGVTQREPKTVLAYSSISQMGLMMVPLGVGLADPGSASGARVAAAAFAMHHALAKAALFLGTAVAKEAASRASRVLVGLGLLWSALEIAGAPLTSGALGKREILAVLEAAPGGAGAFGTLISIAAIGSTLLMTRFLSLLVSARGVTPGGALRAGLWVPWALLLAADTALLIRLPLGQARPGDLLAPEDLWPSAWPLVVGAMITLAVAQLGRRGRLRIGVVPAGDVLWPLLSLLKKMGTGLRRPSPDPAGVTTGPSDVGAADALPPESQPPTHEREPTRLGSRALAALLDRVAVAEEGLGHFRGVGALLLVVLVVLLMGL